MNQARLILALLILANPSTAFAVLGGPPKTSGPNASVQRQPSFSVHSYNDGPTSVREYSKGGKVFAVAWSGPRPPDLRSAFGAYYLEYLDARPGRVLRNERLVTDHLVVETWGHMRDVHGRAYLPSLVPQGVSLDAIR